MSECVEKCKLLQPHCCVTGSKQQWVVLSNVVSKRNNKYLNRIGYCGSADNEHFVHQGAAEQCLFALHVSVQSVCNCLCSFSNTLPLSLSLHHLQKKKQVTCYLLFSVTTAVIGSLQFGYNTGVINAPEQVCVYSSVIYVWPGKRQAIHYIWAKRCLYGQVYAVGEVHFKNASFFLTVFAQKKYSLMQPFFLNFSYSPIQQSL